MTRKTGIVLALSFVLAVVMVEVISGTAPDPFAAPDPMAWGSKDGGSGALCTFNPTQ